MDYFKLSFCYVSDIPVTVINDILSAELGEIGFESFEGDDDGLCAYISSSLYDKDCLARKLNEFPLDGVEFSYNEDFIEGQDWNEEWEKNYFKPICIDKQCIIRASFHADEPGYKHTVLIDPKMAFGTGNHETTRLIITELLKNEFEGKSLLDMGCGTAVLSILARMKGANPVVAIDIDEWAYENAKENIQLNNVPDIDVRLGGVEKISEGETFDIVLANINRNILLNDIKHYAKAMSVGATLWMSGFYTEDIKAVEAESNKNGLTLVNKSEANNWAMIVVRK